ncbi:MAG: AF1514 family protein [Thiohalomonadaceae bacterium]
MQTIKLPDQTTPMDFTQARLTAVGKAGEVLTKPVIVAWKDDRNGKFAPAIPGGTGDRWHDYGTSNEGMLELQVADKFHFIFTDADGFDEPDTNLTSLEDNGTKFLCLNDACTEEDRQRLGYFPGGGMGG